MQPICWGMIGTGNIARSFAKDFEHVEDGELFAVAGRDVEKTKQFAQDFGIEKHFSSNQNMLQDESVEAVYIATPHPSHFSIAMQCLEAGKHILVEKPFMMNTDEAKTVFDFAKSQRLFACEAMWTRFLPFVQTLKKLIRSGEVGEIQTIQSSMGFAFTGYKPDRLFKKELGGGSLLDMGVYCIAFSQMLMRTSPEKITCDLVLGPTEVDHQASWILTYATRAKAIGASSIDSLLANDAVIRGTKGQLRIPEFWQGKEIRHGDKVVSCNYEGMGLHFQVSSANKCIRSGELEASENRWADSLSVLEITDEILKRA